MPGSGNLLRFEFRNRTPWLIAPVFVLLFANLIGSFGVDYWIQHYASRQPSFARPYPINLKASVVVFVPLWLARYEHWSFWLHFLFLGLLFLLFCWYWIKERAVIHVRSQPR